jgi:hypothetical protein
VNSFIPIVFIDIDDVLCVNKPYSGFDVGLALRGRHERGDLVLAGAFAEEAKQTLQTLHEQVGPLRWVVSSSWRLDFTRQEVERVFDAAGLRFVVEGLADDVSWATPESEAGLRADDVEQWLDRHHRGEEFVVLDDLSSGASLIVSSPPSDSRLSGRVILCDIGVGLLSTHLVDIVRILKPGPPFQSTEGDK